jgi:hypothetical protein
MDREWVIVMEIKDRWNELLTYAKAKGERPCDTIIAQWLNETHGHFRDSWPTDRNEVQEALLHSKHAYKYLWVNATRTVAYCDGVREITRQ